MLAGRFGISFSGHSAKNTNRLALRNDGKMSFRRLYDTLRQEINRIAPLAGAFLRILPSQSGIAVPLEEEHILWHR